MILILNHSGFPIQLSLEMLSGSLPMVTLTVPTKTNEVN